MKRRPRKRMIFKLLLFLLAGAIVNVAVAWGCVYRFSSRPTWMTSWHMVKSYWADDFAHFQLQEQLAGMQQLTYFRGIRCSLEEFAELEKRHADDLTTRPDFGFAWLVDDQPADGVEVLFEDSSGWPLRSLSSVAAFDQRLIIGATPIRQAGILIDGNPTRPTLLPVIPEYAPFAINTIFYAAILWILFAAPGALSRKRRRRRGQCVACGYSLRDITSDRCPECGAKA